MVGFGKKHKTAVHDYDNENQAHIGKPATAKGRTLLLLSQLLAILSIACLTVGTALLQRRLHKRRYTLADSANVPNSYSDNLQSAHWTPYPNAHSHQWQMLWWIIGGSFFLWLLTMLLILRAVRIVQWHPALIGFHIYFLVLCTFAIDTFMWINHYSNARAKFGKGRVGVTLAGLLGLAVADGLAVLALGMISSKRHVDARYVQGGGVRERVVEKAVPAPAPAVRQESYRTHLPPLNDAPVFTNNPAQPVRVRQGGAQVTDTSPSHDDPVRVHVADKISNTTGYGSQRY